MRWAEATGAVNGDAPHRPVMVAEVIEILGALPPGPLVDATVGAGGHAAALLDALDPDPGGASERRLLGLDQDEEALTEAASTLARFGDRAVLRQARFDALSAVLAESGLGRPAGVLFDLGVSSMQLDRAERGFSYRQDGPLDMRMDRRRRLTAADVANTYPVEKLARILVVHADERFARRVAKAIVAARPLHTTTQLAEVVRGAIPAAARRGGPDPARRTFQALRLEVNDELTVLPAAIDQAIELLVPGGRCAVLSYHSGEDRIVKDRFEWAVTGGCRCPSALPCVCGARPWARLLWRGVRRPGPAEIESNPRAGSARLRAVERLAEGPGADLPPDELVLDS
jgi:16S rRNA (cytosine1402-N4)-methyltransferase